MSRNRVVWLSGVLMVLAMASIWISQAEGPGGPCPARPRSVRPGGVHFMPGLQEHESWLEFQVAEPDATGFTLCLDGQLFATGVGHTPDNGRVRVNVPTRWVDAQWLRGLLAEDAQLSRWELGYTTYSIGGG